MKKYSKDFTACAIGLILALNTIPIFSQLPDMKKEVAAYDNQGLLNAYVWFEEHFPHADLKDTALRNMLAAAVYYVPESGIAGKAKSQMEDKFKKKFGVSVDDVGVPRIFKEYETWATSLLVQMIQSADDAITRAQEIRNEMKKDTEAQEIVAATYGMLYAAKTAYELYPTANAHVLAAADNKLSELVKVFDLKNTETIRKSVDESDAPGEIFAYWFSLWHELMADRKVDVYAPLCIPGTGYCLGGSSMYWTSLTTKMIGVLTIAAIVYRYYWLVRDVVDAVMPAVGAQPRYAKRRGPRYAKRRAEAPRYPRRVRKEPARYRPS